MPSWPPRPCTYPGCPALVEGASRCPAHPYAPRVYDNASREYDERRGSAKQRGYGWTWEKVRDRHLKRQPLCQHCLLDGVVKPGDLVDHIHELRDGGARFASSNLMTLCNHHHRLKTEAVKRQRAQGAQRGPGATNG